MVYLPCNLTYRKKFCWRLRSPLQPRVTNRWPPRKKIVTFSCQFRELGWRMHSHAPGRSTLRLKAGKLCFLDAGIHFAIVPEPNLTDSRKELQQKDIYVRRKNW